MSMTFLQSNWILAFVFAVVLYGSGKLEAQNGMRNGLLWGALSITVSVLVIAVLGGGWLFEVLAQLGLFVGIGALRALPEQKQIEKGPSIPR
jgi:hypothetical protein